MSKSTFTHPNSKVVYVYKNRTFLESSQTQSDTSVKDYLAQGQVVLGSFFETKDSNRRGTGLSDSEIRLLLPELIEVPADDKEFRKMVTLYYTELRVKVPYGTGLRLEIGLENGNKEGQGPSKDNLPISVVDYIKYRFLLAHPNVGKTEAEAIGNKHKWYYIYDPSVKILDSVNELSYRDEAYTSYMLIKNDPYKTELLLTLLGHNLKESTGKTAEETKNKRTIALNLLMTKDPKKFMETYKMKYFEERFWIKLFEQTQVFKPVGKGYIDSSGTLIGSSVEEVIQWMLTPSNSDRVVSYKAQAQSIIKLSQKQEETPKPETDIVS